MKIITANRLRDGRVVYRREDGTWSSAIKEAAQFDGEGAAANELEMALNDDLNIIGAYLIDTQAQTPSGHKAIREGIRLVGPSAGSLHTKPARA